jgi:hypothetical protein
MTKEVPVGTGLAIISIFVVATVITNSFPHYSLLLVSAERPRAPRQLSQTVTNRAVLVYRIAFAVR